MDRNDYSAGGSTPGQSGGSQNPGGSAGYGNTGNTGGAQGYGAGTTANVGQGFGTESGGASDSQQSQGFTDRARDIAGSAQEKLADVGSTVRDRAGNLKNSLADALDSGANRLRQRGTGSQSDLAGATTSGSVAIENDGRVAQVSNKVASGMESTADWLRDADLDGLRTGLERQVKDHPGRTLLIAAGLGYLIGKAFRNNK
jgi:ElaB/YqjD/DUF883 family membrane-anchored ribosome-binding protein